MSRKDLMIHNKRDHASTVLQSNQYTAHKKPRMNAHTIDIRDVNAVEIDVSPVPNVAETTMSPIHPEMSGELSRSASSNSCHKDRIE